MDTGGVSGKMVSHYCGGNDYPQLLEKAELGACPGIETGFTSAGNVPESTLNADFYTSGLFCGVYGWKTVPGWTPMGSPKHHQFHLQVIDITTLTCSTGFAQKNPAGAYSMCGDDFTAWLNDQVPPVPDSVTVAAVQNGDTVYLNHSGLLDGDVSVDTDQHGLSHTKGKGTINGQFADTAAIRLDVRRRHRANRIGYEGTVRIDDGTTTIITQIRAEEVVQVAPNLMKVTWFDRSLRMNFTLTVRDYDPPPSSS
jgi:hypothetical protein